MLLFHVRGPFPTLSHGDTDLIVVWAVCRLLHRRVLLVIAHFHTHHRVHVQTHQLPSLNHCDADLQEEERNTWGTAAILESSLTGTWRQAAGLGTAGPSPAWSETPDSMLTMAPDIPGGLGISALREVWGLVTPRPVLLNHPREKHYQILVLRPCP